MEKALLLWHDVYAAAIATGCDAAEAVARADDLYWPIGAPQPVEYRDVIGECSPFRDPTEWETR